MVTNIAGSGKSSSEVAIDDEIQGIIDRACGAIDEKVIQADLEEFAKREKLSGTPEELESFRYLEARMKGLGYRTELLMHDAYISLPGPASLDVGGLDFRCITHSFSQATSRLTAEVMDVGACRPESFAGKDLRGKIVVIDGMATPYAAVLASRAGAVGQIHVSPHEYLHEMCISPVWGSPDPDTLSELPETAVVTVSDADGRKIRERLQRGEAVSASIVAEVDTGWRPTPLLTAELLPEGADDDCPFVMFSGHHDTWYYGVMDNGSANATMLAVAEALKKDIRHWRRGLRFCFWSGHSHGRYTSSAWYADTHFQELEARCVVHVNVDSTGGRGNSVLTDTPASTELQGLAREAVLAQAGQEILNVRMFRAGDQSFWGVGVPSIFMGMSEQPIDPTKKGVTYAFGQEQRNGSGFGWWWHTEFDTIDKLDMEGLVRDTRVYCHAVARLLCSETLPIDYASWLEDFRETVADLESAVGKLIDFHFLNDRVDALRGNLTSNLSDRVLMRIERALVPLDFTAGDRYRHDSALPAEPYQVLDPIRRLAEETPGTDGARFASVAARQSLNRVVAMLDEALAALKLV
ncbi:MAG: aminopeptidase [Rhizobiaceae bacterium]|mgnify:CR=1 FL=1|nr:aminopeptidase [Rhizobiaceae bacterium]